VCRGGRLARRVRFAQQPESGRMHSWLFLGRRGIRSRAEIQMQLWRTSPPTEQREKNRRQTRKGQKTGKDLPEAAQQ